MQPDFEKSPRALGGELVIPTLAVAFTLYFFSSIWNSPWTAQVSGFLIGGFLLLACAIFFLRCFAQVRSGHATFGFGTLFSRRDLTSGRLGLLVTTVGYCLLIDRLGFTLTTFLFLSLSMLLLSKGKRPSLIIGISAALSLGGWAVFIWAFETRFPAGWFETAMKAVLANG